MCRKTSHSGGLFYLTFPQQSALISTFPVLKSSPLLASTTGPILSFLLLLWLSLSRLGFTPCHAIFPLSVGVVEREDSVTGSKTNQFSYKLRKLDPLFNFYSVAVWLSHNPPLHPPFQRLRRRPSSSLEEWGVPWQSEAEWNLGLIGNLVPNVFWIHGFVIFKCLSLANLVWVTMPTQHLQIDVLEFPHTQWGLRATPPHPILFQGPRLSHRRHLIPATRTSPPNLFPPQPHIHSVTKQRLSSSPKCSLSTSFSLSLQLPPLKSCYRLLPMPMPTCLSTSPCPPLFLPN